MIFENCCEGEEVAQAGRGGERMNTRVIKAKDTRKMDRERTELNTCHCHPLGTPRWLLCPDIGLGR